MRSKVVAAAESRLPQGYTLKTLGPLASLTLLILITAPRMASATQGRRVEPVRQETSTVTRLVPGKSEERVMSGGQSETFELTVPGGNFLQVEVMQRGIDVVVSLLAPDGRELLNVDSPNGTDGPENIFYVTDAPGTYKLVVRSFDKRAAPGHYQARITALRPATEPDKKLAAGESALIEARKLRATQTAEGFKKSAERLNTALPIFRALGQRARESEILAELGGTYRALSEWQKAIEAYNQSLSIDQELNDRASQAATLHNIGGVYDSLGELEKALDYYNRSLILTRAVGNRAGEGITLTDIGTAYLYAGDTQKALEFFNQALPIIRETKNKYFEAVTLNSIGGAYSTLGQHQRAITFLEQALALRQEVGDKAGEGSTLHNIGVAYDEIGDRQRALDYLNRALSLRHTVGDREGEITTLNALALIYDLTDDKQKALSLYAQALQISRDTGTKYGEALVLSNTGLVYISLGNNQQALDLFNRALLVARSAGDKRTEAFVLNHIGRVYDLQGEGRKALEFFNEALPIIRGTGDTSGEAYTLSSIAYTYDSLGDKKEAIRYYEQALKIARETGARFYEALLLHNIGFAYDTLGDTQKAENYYTQSLQLTKSVGDRYGEAKTLYTLGHVRERLQDYKQALDFYLKSIEVGERLRSSATIEEIKSGLAGETASAYQHAALLLMREGQQAQAFELTERARARTLLDQVGNLRPEIYRGVPAQLISEEQRLSSEIDSLRQRITYERTRPSLSPSPAAAGTLESQLAARQREYEDLVVRLKLSNSEYASLRSVNPLSLVDSQRLLDANTTLLSYYVTPEKTLAFVITRDGFHAAELPVREDELARVLTEYRSFDDLNSPQPESLKQLYGWLIAPIEDRLRTPVVGIIPHGLLHYLPFAALTDGQGYLGDRHTLFTLPSASVLRFILQKRKPGGNRLLALAENKAEGLPILHHVNEEVRGVAALYGAKPLLGKEATESALRARAGEYDIVHIAAHGQLTSPNPLFSHIILSPSKGNDGLLDVRDVYRLNLARTSVVVLSACDTQLGAQNRGDDIVALNRAFIYAGAPTVISSLWTVDDEATGELMLSFYRHLRRGMSKADALRAAQRETRMRHPHPYYWAGFVISGDPGVTISGRPRAVMRRH